MPRGFKSRFQLRWTAYASFILSVSGDDGPQRKAGEQHTIAAPCSIIQHECGSIAAFLDGTENKAEVRNPLHRNVGASREPKPRSARAQPQRAIGYSGQGKRNNGEPVYAVLPGAAKLR